MAMKNEFLSLKQRVNDLTISELQQACSDLVEKITEVDSSLISVNKGYVSYRTWKSKGYVNRIYFGDELTELILSALNSEITHDEEKEFVIKDFSGNIYERILENI